MNPWDEDLTVIENQTASQTANPWEEELVVTKPRGANLAGAIRNIAQATPWIGTRADESEAAIRSRLGGGDYETLRRNAEESALGNIANTSYGRAMNIGANMAENAVLGALTRGLTLHPLVSGLQGAVEGYGRGSTPDERARNAAIEGAAGTVIPMAFNKVLSGSTKMGLSDLLKPYTQKLTSSAEPALKAVRDYSTGGSNSLAESLSKEIGYQTQKQDIKDIARNLRSNSTLFNMFRKEAESQPTWRARVIDVIDDVISKAPKKDAKQLTKAKNAIAGKITDADEVAINSATDEVVTNFSKTRPVTEINDALSGYKISKETNSALTNQLNKLKGTRRAEKIALGIDAKTVGVDRSPSLGLGGMKFLKLQSGLSDIGKVTTPQTWLQQLGISDSVVAPALSLPESLLEGSISKYFE